MVLFSTRVSTDTQQQLEGVVVGSPDPDEIDPRSVPLLGGRARDLTTPFLSSLHTRRNAGLGSRGALGVLNAVEEILFS